MNEQELLELEQILEHPEDLDDITEEDFHKLAEVYHLARADELTKKILEDALNEEIENAEDLATHQSFPTYRHHIDEAIRHRLAYTPVIEEVVNFPGSMDKFTRQMSPRLEDVLKAASKRIGGELLKPEEEIHDSVE